MAQSLSLFIGLRYTRAKRKNHFISFISMTSMIGIGLGVLVLITVLSVMNGFEQELEDRVLGVAPHATIHKAYGPFEEWEALLPRIEAHPRVLGAAPFIETEGLIRALGDNTPVLVRGVLPEYQKRVSILPNYMKQGSIEQLHAGKFGIVLGQPIADRLGLSLGDKVTLMVAEGTTASIAGVMPRFKRFELVGTFKSETMNDYNLVLLHMDDTAKLIRSNGGVTGVRLKVDELFDAAEIGYQVSKNLGSFEYRYTFWGQTLGNFFQAVKMEKTILFFILLLIIAIAAFNIVSTLVMVVTDKQADIAILRTLGASPRTIMKIFMVQGTVNGVLGTLLGTVLGCLLAANVPELVEWLEKLLNQDLISDEVYFIGYLPSKLMLEDIVKVSGASLLMSILATIYPARKAAKTQPAEALRYE